MPAMVPYGRMGSDVILDAVVKLVATREPEETSVRNVARDAGVSVGAVQYHYRTKDELLSAAMGEMDRRFREHMQQILSQITDPKQRLRAFLYSIAAAHDDAREGAVIWTVFAARASVNKRLQQEHSDNWQQAEAAILDLLQAAFPERSCHADDAAMLLAVTDGIAVARAAETPQRMTAKRAETLIDKALANIMKHGQRKSRPQSEQRQVAK